MLYALARKDGGVSIMQMLPVRGRVLFLAFDVLRIMPGKLLVVRHIDGIVRELSHSVVHSADWQVDSIPDCVLEFARPEDEVAKKPSAEELRAQGVPESDIAAAVKREDIVSMALVVSADLSDRTFRDAWTCEGNALKVDMPKARDHWRNRMRAARAPLLAALDVEYQRADEEGDVAKKQDVARRKKALRDVTVDPAIEAAKTPDALKAVWPAVLGLFLLLMALVPAAAFQPRETVTADRTYFFRPDAPVDALGNEVNNCTSDKVASTPGYVAPDGACRYMQTAVELAGKLRCDWPVKVTFQVSGTGVRTMTSRPSDGMPGTMFLYDPHEGNCAVWFKGDSANPNNVVLQSEEGGNGFWCRAPGGLPGAPVVSGPVFLDGFKIVSPKGWGVRWSCRGTLSVGNLVLGDTCFSGVCGVHMGVDWDGATLVTHGPITVVGGAKILVHADTGTVWLHSHSIHIDPNVAPSFVDGTINAFHRSMTWNNAQWSGATGANTPKCIVKSGATVKNIATIKGSEDCENVNGFVE